MTAQSAQSAVVAPRTTSTITLPIEGDALNKLVRRGYWMDMNDRTLVMVMIECAEFSFHLF